VEEVKLVERKRSCCLSQSSIGKQLFDGLSFFSLVRADGGVVLVRREELSQRTPLGGFEEKGK